MIAQTSTEYKIRPTADGRFRIIDKNQHNHGVYPTRDAADVHILELTAARSQTHRAARDLAQAGAVAMLALALLITPAGSGTAQARGVCLAKRGTAIVYRAGVRVVVPTVWRVCSPNGGSR